MNYGAQRAAAERAVAGLTGVRNVRDDIEIDADPVDVTVLVRDALDRSAIVADDSAVVVDTNGHTVTLSGHVGDFCRARRGDRRRLAGRRRLLRHRRPVHHRLTLKDARTPGELPACRSPGTLPGTGPRGAELAKRKEYLSCSNQRPIR